jgi:carboxypeptidase PM20D1
MKLLFKLLFVGLLLFIGVLVANTFRFSSRQVEVAPFQTVLIDKDSALVRFSKAIQFKTTSLSAFVGNTEEMQKLHEYLRTAFPKIHATLTRDTIGAASVYYTWRGKDTTLKPIVLMGHIDVVPVIPGTESKWTHDAYSGEVANGYIWGRGSMDDKSTVMAVLESVEALLAHNFQPKRTIILAFGHDEEVGGMRGAKRMTDFFREKKMQFECVIDEGGAIVEGAISGLDKPAALIGIAEKGYTSIEITAEAKGGHSSMPPPHTAVGVLASAITALEENQMPASLSSVTKEFFLCIGPEMNFLYRVAIANLWATEKLVVRFMQSTPQGNAIVRTTTAPTMLTASVKDNILPIGATAIVNFRIHPNDSISTVLEHIRRVTQNDSLKLKLYDGSASINPSPVSSTESSAFQLLNKTIRGTYPDAIVAPYLVLGGTDAKHYAGLSNSIYRFSPFRLSKDDMGRAHGTDERLTTESYLKGIQFYYHFITASNEL